MANNIGYSNRNVIARLNDIVDPAVKRVLLDLIRSLNVNVKDVASQQINNQINITGASKFLFSYNITGGSANFSIDLTPYTSIYSAFRLVMRDIYNSSSQRSNVRFSVGGSVDSGSNYSDVSEGSAGTTFNNGASVIQFMINTGHNAAGFGMYGPIDLWTLNGHSFITSTFGYYENSATRWRAEQLFGINKTLEADGIQFTPAAGTYSGGEMWIYGL